jgi:hypothetical protein
MRSSRVKALLAVFSALIVCACSAGDTAPLPDSLAIGRTTTLSPGQIRVVQNAVKANLDNPKSAKFGRIVAGISNTGTTHVCGLVDAKEQDGSYSGMTVYSGEFDGDAFQFDGLGDSLELICAQQGLTPER